MANSIAYAQRFVPIIDEIYKANAVTEGMDAAVKPDFSGVNEVKVFKVSTTGLGNYSRETGYPKGDVTAAWETMKLTCERGKEISIDRMDDEETLGLAFGQVTGTFIRNHVAPELDAYRFAKYASTSGVKTTEEKLEATNILNAFDEAVREMDANEVPEAGRRLYVNSDLKPVLNQAASRQWGSESGISNVLTNYNGMPIIYVPKSRFYTDVTLNAGTSEWGYKKTDESGKDINFMLIYPEAILQVTKFALPKVFSPDENQEKDAWKFQFRLYHDCFVYENKKVGVYVHTAPSEAA